MAEKSVFAELLKFLLNGNNKSEVKNISAQDAVSLQKNYIENLSKNKTDICSPPYLEIAKQLNSTKSEIFQAAVFYLTQISENESRYAAPIISILKKCKKGKKRSAEDMDYLDFCLDKLEKQNSAFSIKK